MVRRRIAPRIQRLDPSRLDDVVDLFVDSFWDYPVMRFALVDTAAEDYDRELRVLVGYFAGRRFAQDQYVFGIEHEGALAAAALVDGPNFEGDPEATAPLEAAVVDAIGPGPFRRLGAFGAAHEPFEPKEPHYYLGMLGSRRSAQGLGLGSALLIHVAAVSREDPASVAVCLSTETAANVPFYKARGYEVLGEADVGTLHTWSMMHRTG